MPQDDRQVMVIHIQRLVQPQCTVTPTCQTITKEVAVVPLQEERHITDHQVQDIHDQQVEVWDNQYNHESMP